jgi:hypothetical protein
MDQSDIARPARAGASRGGDARLLVPAALLALALALAVGGCGRSGRDEPGGADALRSSQELVMPDFPEGIIPA